MTNDVQGPGLDTILYTSPPLDAYEMRRREKAAGYAHIDRMAVCGTVTETKPIRRRRLTLHGVLLAGLWVYAIALIVLLWEIMT